MPLSAIAELGQRWDVPHPGSDPERARSVFMKRGLGASGGRTSIFPGASRPSGDSANEGFSRRDRVR